MNKFHKVQDGSSLSDPVIVCFSHLRWNFVYQRPQHLMSHAARNFRVLFVEEPLIEDAAPHLRVVYDPSGVAILTPVFAHHCDPVAEQRQLISSFLSGVRPRRLIQWFYTPMALRFARGLKANLVVYDCMDELSAFRFAPAELRDLETELLQQADLVFTGGESLYAAKKSRHHDVHCYPSSVDTLHFARARRQPADPADQAALPYPRIGYFGVIDERMDLDLVARTAADLPDVQFVMLGPIVKIDPADLPRAANIHWLGGKSYGDLPAYLGNWQAGWMPFALNEHTRFISPTKTPEFLAAGLPVTSTAVADVVSGWARGGLVRIADARSMPQALRASLAGTDPEWARKVDRRLSDMSWEGTWRSMESQIMARLRMAVVA